MDKHTETEGQYGEKAYGIPYSHIQVATQGEAEGDGLVANWKQKRNDEETFDEG